MSRSFRVLEIFVSVAAVAGQCWGQDSPDYGRRVDAGERLKILEMLSTRMRQNYEGIKTWGGVYEATTRLRLVGTNPSLPGTQANPGFWMQGGEPLDRGKIQLDSEADPGYWEIRKGTIRFDLDNVEDRYHVFYSAIGSDGILDVPTGTEVRYARDGDILHTIVTRNHCLLMDVNRSQGKLPAFAQVDPIDRGRVIYRRAAAKFTRSNIVMIDPRDFFTTTRFVPSRDTFPWLSCDVLCRALRGDARSSKRFVDLVEQKLVIYASSAEPPVYTIISPFHGTTTITSQYDGQSGFNLVMERKSDGAGKSHRHCTTTYRKVSGTFIPETIERQMFNDSPEKNTYREELRSYKLVSTELNQPIPVSEFDAASFGLIYGDRMVDQIENKLYVYDDVKGFVPADEFTFDKTRVKDAITK